VLVTRGAYIFHQNKEIVLALPDAERGVFSEDQLAGELIRAVDVLSCMFVACMHIHMQLPISQINLARLYFLSPIGSRRLVEIGRRLLALLENRIWFFSRYRQKLLSGLLEDQRACLYL
jgi:hypothetical protein